MNAGANRVVRLPGRVVEKVIDMVFVADMLLQFCVAYQSEDDDETAGAGKRWVLEPRKVAWHYASSRWFALDFFSIGTSAFDLFGSEDTSNLSALRVLRALRLVKLVRLLRGSRVLLRWEKRLSINYAYLGLIQSVTAILMSAHWFACIWGLQASFDRLHSWMADTGYCVALPSDASNVSAAVAQQLLDACPPFRSCEFSECTASGGCSGGSMCEDAMTTYLYSLCTPSAAPVPRLHAQRPPPPHAHTPASRGQPGRLHVACAFLARP